MADETLVNRLTDIVDEITRLGGEQELTSIVPGILVADSEPSDLPTGYIKIVNPRDGAWVPCLTISGLVVEDNDLVNVLFTKGTEPIALAQSATSPSNTFKVSEVWESDFDAVALQADEDGGIGIGTATIPHSGVGMAMFAIDGAAGNAKGPHIQLTTDQDDFPRLGIYPWSDDDIRILFDCYRTGVSTFLSSDTGSNFSFEKNANRLGMFYSQGNAQGASVSFLDGIILNRDGEVGIGEFSPSDKLTVKGLAGADCDIGFYANDGDGTDSINLSLYGVGTPGATINRERLLIQYDDTGPIFRIQSEANGTGTVRDLVIETEGNSNQLYLDSGSGGKIGIGTSVIPKGGVGVAKLAIEGDAISIDGPHIQITISTSNYPLFQHYSIAHNSMAMIFDGYWDGSNLRSSNNTSNYMIRKESNEFSILGEFGIAAGSVMTLDEFLTFTSAKAVFNNDSIDRDFQVKGNAGQLFFEGSSGNFGIGTASGADNLTIQGQSGANATMALYTGDGDGTDFSSFVIYGVGTPGSITNRERLIIQYDRVNGNFRLQSEAQGTGTLRPIVFETEGNTDQLNIDTSGNIGLSVSSPSTRLDIGAGAIEFNEMTAPAAGAVNTARLFARDNGAGKTQLCVRFNTGAIQVLATEP